MARPADRDHMDACKKCGKMVVRSKMRSAKVVEKRSNARGYWCQFCSDQRTNLFKRIGL